MEWNKRAQEELQEKAEWRERDIQVRGCTLMTSSLRGDTPNNATDDRGYCRGREIFM